MGPRQISGLSCSPMEAIQAATLVPARVMKLDRELGTVEAGKRADVITVQRNSLALQPWHDPRAGLAYAARGLDVQDVWVDGQPRVADGKLIADDVDAVIQHAEAWAMRFKKSKEVMTEK